MFSTGTRRVSHCYIALQHNDWSTMLYQIYENQRSLMGAVR